MMRDYRNFNKKSCVKAVTEEVVNKRNYFVKTVVGDSIWKTYIYNIIIISDVENVDKSYACLGNYNTVCVIDEIINQTSATVDNRTNVQLKIGTCVEGD